MKKINKCTEPQSLTEYRSCISNNEVINSNIYDDFKYKSKEDCAQNKNNNLRKQLLEEQGSICCYCMSRISCYNSKIEHFKPQSNPKYRNLQIDYQNLFIACNGGEGNRRGEQFCDTHKKECELNAINLLTNIENDIVYKKKGKLISVQSNNSNINKELEEILNLNVNILQKNRMESYSSVIKNLKQKGFSISNIKRTMQYYKTKHNGKFEPFCEMIVYFLTKKLISKGASL